MKRRAWGRDPASAYDMMANPSPCPYCGGPAKLLGSSTPIYGKDYGPIWVCLRYPACDSYVGCHKGTTKPLGRMADKALRLAKSRVHRLFDPMWRAKIARDGCSRHTARAAGYAWLALQLRIPVEKCHVGLFDLELCGRAVDVLGRFYRRVSAV